MVLSSPKKVLALTVGLGLPFAIWAGWALGALSGTGPTDPGAGSMGGAPAVSPAGRAGAPSWARSPDQAAPTATAAAATGPLDDADAQRGTRADPEATTRRRTRAHRDGETTLRPAALAGNHPDP